MAAKLMERAAEKLVTTAGKQAASWVSDKVSKAPVRAALGTGLGRIKDKIKDKIKGLFGGGGKGKPKLTNIVESIDVGVPVDVAYAQWTRFTEFPEFMKKVENVEQTSDETLTWKAQIFWSHRTWESKIIEQVPNERIVWRSQGAKGYVDGAVTFHEFGPQLTRIVLVLEYHPQGLFERTGNIWRAQGRRARLELKHFQRHVMTQTILHPDEVEGWPGEIRDGEVVDQEAAANRAEEEPPEDVEEEPAEDLEEEEPDEEDEEFDEDLDDEDLEDEAEPDDEESPRPRRRKATSGSSSRSRSSGGSTRSRSGTRARTRK